MLKTPVYWIYKQASRVLRKTALRRVTWLANGHNRIFGILSNSSTLHLNDYVLQVDSRDRVLAKKLALYGEYEEYTRNLLISLAAPGSVVVDVGANVGLHTIPLAHRVNSTGKVLAFEPDPDNFRILQKNIQINKISNVVAYKLALSAQAEAALLYQSVENRGGLSLRLENVESRSGYLNPVLIETAVGDDLLANLDQPISLIKIDVEGAEPLVLSGMKKVLEQNVSVKIVFEFWPRYIRSFEINPLDFLIQLEKDGFQLEIIDSNARRLVSATAADIVKRGDSADAVLTVLAARHLPTA